MGPATTVVGTNQRQQVPTVLYNTPHEQDNDDYSSSSSSWSVTDDWSLLSQEHPENAAFDGSFQDDWAIRAAKELEEQQQQQTATTSSNQEEDVWIDNVMNDIYNPMQGGATDVDHPLLYDTKFDEDNENDNDSTKIHSSDVIGDEIAMLVRCNERPEELLISEGRALPPLTDREKYDPQQLVKFHIHNQEWKATPFLKDVVSQMFQRHATPNENDNIDNDKQLGMDRKGVAQWMTLALQSEPNEGTVSAHESRVIRTISQYGSYGSGRLVEDDFQKLYLSTIVGEDNMDAAAVVSPVRHLQMRQPFIDAVWRDIRNHGHVSPVEQERKRLEQELQAKTNLPPQSKNNQNNMMTMMDECEILDWDYRSDQQQSETAEERIHASGKMSSHQLVEMAPADNKTPLWVRDGDFIFIDEESCIGCMQCANVAPGSFLMLDSGRARTFKQRHTPDVQQAVASCPVSCMHSVSYRELKDFETARDVGDGRTDHRHLGNPKGHIPLHVAGMSSDSNQRSSWYHTLKWRCVTSSDCPQKGCYDCRKYQKAGDNPYFQKRQREAEHVRAQYFLEHGDVDKFRKTADL